MASGGHRRFVLLRFGVLVRNPARIMGAFPSRVLEAGAARSGDALEFPEKLTATLTPVDSTTRRAGNSIMLIATCWGASGAHLFATYR
jgi:hypothetical protein